MKSCREITKLVVSGDRFTLVNRISIVMHLLMCRACRLFKLQTDSIDSAISTEEPAVQLDDDARERIKEQISSK
ncbi:MAG: hypothetical protein QF444_00510 [Phycisphaerales bacterium]|nr:hypothetical protein [Phycisphaerales bacterium]